MDHHSFKESIAFWSSLLGTVVGLLGVVQSASWLTAAGGVLWVVSGTAVIYARNQHQRLRLATLRVEGRSIDSLNAGNVNRRINANLLLQQARNAALISGEDLSITWECIGYCRQRRATQIEFSLDSDNNIPFNELECCAYDLRCDPAMKHKIRPLLVGPDGVSKKIAVPFLSPIASQQPFHILLRCELPGCMKSGVEYYTTSLSFEQDVLDRYSTQLTFEGNHPDWLRVYDMDGGAPHLVKDLEPSVESERRTEYFDAERRVNARSARIYVFRRAA